MRKISVIFSVLCIILCGCIPVFAAGNNVGNLNLSSVSASSALNRVNDEAGLMSLSEYEMLSTKLDEISSELGADVVVVTANDTRGKSMSAYADDYFDYNGYGQGENYSGVLLLHVPTQREWYISTSGNCIKVFTASRIDKIGDKMIPYLADGDNYGAYLVFAEQCKNIMLQYGDDASFTGKLPFRWISWKWIPVSLILGFVFALLIVNSMKNKLKTVHFRTDARDYFVKNSFNVTDSREMFLYRNVTKHKIASDTPKSSGGNVHNGSSGRSHGGGGGRY